MYGVFRIIRTFIDSGILIYSVFIFLTFVVLAIFSAFAMVRYLRKNSYIDYSAILSSPISPSISIIAPAFNEGKTIIANIRSLLSIHYNNLEVIIINDGSMDDSLEKIIQEYKLELVNFAYNPVLPTKKINGIYKSTNKAFSKLIVIDKENGGKADALNAGINLSTKKYFAAIDVDSILEQDALLKMIKPFLEEEKSRVIATGGVIRIANSCRVEDGQIVEVNLPKQWLPRIQVLEYTRAFLMGRMAWSRLNGLLLISGAFGLFDREIVVKCGGYNSNTVGEDMELVLRMRRYMHDQKEKYRVVYIPDPLCWTEVPSDLKTLGRQRNRWTRGTMDTLRLHKKILFNPKYGILGMYSYPYWLFFEWLAPIIETIGVFYFFLVIAIGNPNWSFFISLILFVYFFAVTFSLWAILFEELSYHRYKNTKDMVRIIAIAFIEPIFYHPMTVWFSLRGNYHYLIRKSGWGTMERKGFSGKSDKKQK